jgi:hypothetical protein
VMTSPAAESCVIPWQLQRTSYQKWLLVCRVVVNILVTVFGESLYFLRSRSPGMWPCSQRHIPHGHTLNVYRHQNPKCHTHLFNTSLAFRDQRDIYVPLTMSLFKSAGLTVAHFFSMLPSTLKYLYSVEPVRMHFPAKQPCTNDTACNAANSIPLFLHAAIYLEVSLFRWTSQNAFSRETAVYELYCVQCCYAALQSGPCATLNWFSCRRATT